MRPSTPPTKIRKWTGCSEQSALLDLPSERGCQGLLDTRECHGLLVKGMLRCFAALCDSAATWLDCWMQMQMKSICLVSPRQQRNGAIIVDIKNAWILLRNFACSRSKHKQIPSLTQEQHAVNRDQWSVGNCLFTFNFDHSFCSFCCVTIISPAVMVNARSQKSQPLSLEYLTDTLPSLLPPIFDQAQQTTANHRKNIVYLRKIHEQCASIVEEISDDRIKLTGEKAFNSLFFDMVNRVLTVKKGVAVADRVVKFVANYVSYCTETGKPFLYYLLLYDEFDRFFQMLLISMKTKMTKRKRTHQPHASLPNSFDIFWEVLRPKTRMSDFESLLWLFPWSMGWVRWSKCSSLTVPHAS